MLSLAQDGSPHAASALAQALPFMIADRKDSMAAISENWDAPPEGAKASVRASLKTHLLSGALSHRAYFKERRWAERLLE